MKEFDKVRLETVKFMRGKYRLDEISGMNYGIPCVRFRQGKKTVVAIFLYDDITIFKLFSVRQKEKSLKQ